jgi:acetyl esterase/lipase
LTLDCRAKRFLALIQAATPGRDGDEVASLRRATDALADFAAPPPEVERRDFTLHLDGRALNARAYAPSGAVNAALPGLVYFHGGGLISGGLASHDSVCAELADAAKCRVVAVDYRLGPEHRFPAAHDDAVDAVREIASRAAEFGLDPKRFGVGGDSAGGNLAAYAARRAGVKLKLLFLLCPVLDMLGREASRFELRRDYLIEEATMQCYWAHYQVDGLSSEDPRVAPLRGGAFEDYPPTRIHTAQYDPLKDEGAAFFRAIAAAGGDARLAEHEGQIHHFYGLTGAITSARPALEQIGADLAAGLSGDA